MPEDDHYGFGGDGTRTIATCQSMHKWDGDAWPDHPWLGQAFETWHPRPPTLLGHTPEAVLILQVAHTLTLRLPPHCTRPLGLPRAVATPKRGTTTRTADRPILGAFGHPAKPQRQHAQLNTCRPVSQTQLSCRAGRSTKGVPVRLPDNTEWGPAAAASHSKRDTSGALDQQLQAVHG
ncbi:hypothetical protein VTI28DRAFT_3572 [Corynascus sepedonium]